MPSNSIGGGKERSHHGMSRIPSTLPSLGLYLCHWQTFFVVKRHLWWQCRQSRRYIYVYSQGFKDPQKKITSLFSIYQTCQAKIPIILLIQSFAYLSISLDISGFFKQSALAVVKLARGNGHRLLIYVYVLCSILTYFTSNDIVIISMTPLIIHIGDCSNIKNVVPLLITQYIAANTSSMGLLVGSPTNIILGKPFFLVWWLSLSFSV